jgi:hypothetical protein
MLRRFDGADTMTLRDAYSKNPKQSWTEFTSTVDSLVSQGYLTAKGDGFVVHYFLTNKGRNAIGLAH